MRQTWYQVRKQGTHQTLQRRGEVWPALMTLFTCPVYGREGGVLGQLRIKATGPEAEGSKRAVTISHIILSPLKG